MSRTCWISTHTPPPRTPIRSICRPSCTTRTSSRSTVTTCITRTVMWSSRRPTLRASGRRATCGNRAGSSPGRRRRYTWPCGSTCGDRCRSASGFRFRSHRRDGPSTECYWVCGGYVTVGGV
uniref:(northern house mosquito) hypothetical protein n=1 Tax=Culex pipiens TaxID=7175 RepID=A0A8D8BJN6_CULPI